MDEQFAENRIGIQVGYHQDDTENKEKGVLRGALCLRTENKVEYTGDHNGTFSI